MAEIDGFGQQIHDCPACGSAGVGFPGHGSQATGVLAARGGVPFGITHLTDDDGDPANPAHTRGSWIEIPIVGETCNCDLRFVIAFHKGALVTGLYPA